MFENASWMIPMEKVGEDQIVKTYTADVVVLGAGYSGTAAAKAAAEAGASVLVVEMQQEKNFQVFGAQYGSVNSEFMKKRGAPTVDPVEIIADWQRRSLNRANPHLIRQFAYNTGSTFDWFVDALPEDMKDVLTFENPWPKHFTGELNGYNNYVGTAIFKNSKKPHTRTNIFPHPENHPKKPGKRRNLLHIRLCWMRKRRKTPLPAS